METNPRLIVLTTVYNCESYIEKCITSIKNQSYKNFKCYLLNDMSTDNSVDIAKSLVGDDDRFVFINNDKKRYQLGNYDHILRDKSLVNDEDIAVEVDGDDWLPVNDIFKRVVKYYSKGDVWITYGQFKYSTGHPGFAAPVDINSIRTSRFTASHLRTWKVWLWNRIDQDDLKVDGQYPQCSGDVFFMMPMLEMAGKKHSKFVKDINYVYNFENPIGVSRGDGAQKQQDIAEIGRNKQKYDELS